MAELENVSFFYATIYWYQFIFLLIIKVGLYQIPWLYRKSQLESQGGLVVRAGILIVVPMGMVSTNIFPGACQGFF